MATTNAHETNWTRHYEALVAFRTAHGHCDIARSHGPLGLWAGTQRGSYKKGTLSAHRVRRLEGIGFAWGRTHLRWEDRFREVVAYKEREGDCRVPISYRPNPALAQWVRNQRKQRGSLAGDRVARLDAIGFAWALDSRRRPRAAGDAPPSSRAPDDRGVDHGAAPDAAGVAARHSAPGGRRKRKRTPPSPSGTAKEKSREKGEAATEAARNTSSAPSGTAKENPGKQDEAATEAARKTPSTPSGTAQEKSGKKDDAAAKAARNVLHGNPAAPGGNAEEKSGKKDAATANTAHTMASTHAYEKNWVRKYEALVEFRRVHGHCNAIRTHALGRWVVEQRERRKAGKLAAHRAARLEGLGFAWGQERVRWEDRLRELVAHREREGTCNVHKKRGPLGTWVSTQRTCYKDGSLSEERAGRLEEIGFEWVLLPRSAGGEAARRGRGTSTKKETARASKDKGDKRRKRGRSDPPLLASSTGPSTGFDNSSGAAPRDRAGKTGKIQRKKAAKLVWI